MIIIIFHNCFSTLQKDNHYLLYKMFFFTDDYSAARTACQEAETNSDIQSDKEFGRGMRRCVYGKNLLSIPLV